MPFINYRASAGSGKTYRLVLEYLNLVLENENRFSHILAITFTNKAAAEMKSRILKSLENLADDTDETLKNNLRKKNRSLIDIKKRSETVLKKILHNYSKFSIMTIDSFINRLVRAFSYETDIPPGFDVELNYSRMNNYVSKNILSGIGTDLRITELVTEFVFSKIVKNESWNIEKNISDLLKEMNKEQTDTTIEHFMNVKPDKLTVAVSLLKKKFSSVTDKIARTAKKGMELIENSGFSVNDFSYKGKSAAGYLKYLTNLEEVSLKEIKYPWKQFEIGFSPAKGCREGLTESLSGEMGDKLELIRSEILSLFEKDLKDALTAFMIFENIYILGLIGSINKFLSEYKKEYHTVPIFDLTKMVHKIINNGDIPFIYFILGDSFENIMVDEFQDTSRMQWDSLLPLIENSNAEGRLNLGVGDEKQSIYRWRGGDLDIMNREVVERFSKENLEIVDLPFNYRSCKNIVDFNNTLFKEIKSFEISNELLARVYDKSKQETAGPEGGYVSVKFLPKEDFKQEVLEEILKIINKCKKSGFSLSDIAILTGKRKNGMEVASFLMEKDISIITPELLKLNKSPLTFFFIDLLGYLIDPDNRLALTGILSYITRYFKKSVWTFEKSESYFINPVKINLPDCLIRFNKKRNFLLRLPIYETIEEFIRIFDLYKSLEPESSGSITSFLDMISEYSETQGGGIQGFLEWWELNGIDFTIPTPEETDGIRIMTIHKAKGLEFPVVIIPYTDWKTKTDTNVWLECNSPVCNIDGYPPPFYVKSVKSLENTHFSDSWSSEKLKREVDYVNMFYVACTRAQDALFLFSKEKSKPDSTKLSNYNLLRSATNSGLMEKEGENLFSLGQPKKISFRKKIGETIKIKDEEMISYRWGNKITIRESSEKFWDLSSEIHADKIDRGIIIHEILSYIDSLTPLETVMERLEYSGRIGKREREEIELQLTKILKIPEVKKWFFGEGEFLKEQPIISKQGIFLPDRIILSGDSATVIDFKTGAKSESHKLQVEAYMELLKEMGNKDVKGAILYIPSGEIIKV